MSLTLRRQQAKNGKKTYRTQITTHPVLKLKEKNLGTSLHVISLQNSLCESYTWRLVSWKALRELNAHCSLPVYPVFEDEKSNGSDEKSVKRKIALKKDKQDKYNHYKFLLRAIKQG